MSKKEKACQQDDRLDNLNPSDRKKAREILSKIQNDVNSESPLILGPFYDILLRFGLLLRRMGAGEVR